MTIRARVGRDEQAPADYWTRTHTEHVVLDIGGDYGALVIYASPELRGREIEISPLGRERQRVHAAVLERVVEGRRLFAAVYPRVLAGVYRVWDQDDRDQVQHVYIKAGAVAEVDLRPSC